MNVGMEEVKISYQVWLGNIDRIYHVEDLSKMKLGLRAIGCKHVHLKGLVIGSTL
jgi:hypothetical protein